MIDCEEIYDRSKPSYINSIYYAIRSYDEHNGTDIEDAKVIFIEVLKYMIEKKKCIIVFRDWVENKTELENSSLEEQLSYIYQSFPTEYDENDPEKDIENLWWYFGCPIDIGWLQPDGSYWFS